MTSVGAPLLIAWFAGFVNATHQLPEPQQWVSVGRLLLPLALAIQTAGLVFAARQIRRSPTPLTGVSSDVVAFIAGGCISFVAPFAAVLLWVFGGPILEVYAYAILASVYGLVWSWKHRNLLGAQPLWTESHRLQGQYGRDESNTGQADLVLLRHYTVFLGVVGSMALFLAATGIAGLMHGGSEPFILYNVAVATLFGLSALFLYAATILRACKSPLAPFVTTVASLLMISLFPVGPLLLLYWLLWVRSREEWPGAGATA